MLWGRRGEERGASGGATAARGAVARVRVITGGEGSSRRMRTSIGGGTLQGSGHQGVAVGEGEVALWPGRGVASRSFAFGCVYACRQACGGHGGRKARQVVVRVSRVARCGLSQQRCACVKPCCVGTIVTRPRASGGAHADVFAVCARCVHVAPGPRASGDHTAQPHAPGRRVHARPRARLSLMSIMLVSALIGVRGVCAAGDAARDERVPTERNRVSFRLF